MREFGRDSRRSAAVGALIVAVAILLSACAGAPPPVTEKTDTSLPASPISDQMVRCLDDAGWQITRSLQGGFDGPVNLPTSQKDQFDAAFGSCADETGWSIPLSDFTDAQKHQLYQQEVASHACLVTHGYAGNEPPSEQTYLDTFSSANQYYAFMAIADLHRAEQEPLIRVCPPPTWFLNIDGFPQ